MKIVPRYHRLLAPFLKISTEENLEARGKINMNSSKSRSIQNLEKSLKISQYVWQLSSCNPRRAISTADLTKLLEALFLPLPMFPLTSRAGFLQATSVQRKLCSDDKRKAALNDQLPSGVHRHYSWCEAVQLEHICGGSTLQLLLLLTCVMVKPRLGCCSHPWSFHPYSCSKQLKRSWTEK